jgi:hypothetical protein
MQMSAERCGRAFATRYENPATAFGAIVSSISISTLNDPVLSLCIGNYTAAA